MKIVINGNKYTLSKMNIGVCRKYYLEFGTDIFTELGSIDKSKLYFNMQDMDRIRNIFYASIWFCDNTIKFEDFAKDFDTLFGVNVEDFIPEINFITAGLDTKVESTKK